MTNPEIKRELDPAWFLPAPNHDPYTKGFTAGRDYERNRISTILEDWTLNAQWTWADIHVAIDEGMEWPTITVSRQALESRVFDEVNRERERIIDNITAALHKLSPATDADHNPVIDSILAIVKEAIYGQAAVSSDTIRL